MTREQVARSAGIGASEVAAIAGASPWGTPVSVWLDKVGLARERDDTGPMAAGRALEPAILRMGAERLGTRLVHNARRHTHPDWPRVPLFATPDAFGPGRLSLGEVKLVGHRFSDWADGPPDYVALQVQAQLACFPRARSAYVIALLGSDLRTYTVDADPAAQATLAEQVADWWRRYVVSEVSPDTTGPADEWALLRARVVTTGRQERLATPDEQLAGAEIAALLAQRADLDARIESRREAMAHAADESDVAGVGWVARWSSRATTDWRAVATTYGLTAAELAPFTRSAPVFTFRRTNEAQP